MATAAKQPATQTLTPQDIRDHYDQFAWAYRLYWGDHLHHGLFLTGQETAQQSQELMLRHCAGRAGVRLGTRVADVGCGYGGTTRFLAREYSCNVLGITISPTQFTTACDLSKSLAGPGSVRFEVADAEAYEFPSEEFDLVWNMESSEHFFDKAAYFRKVAVALKPGGRLMLAAWTGSMEHELISNIARVFLCPELLTTAEYACHLQDAGLRMLSSEQLAPEVLPTWDICAGHARQAGVLLSFLPAHFREFVDGIEMMRVGYRNGQLTYSVVVAEKEQP